AATKAAGQVAGRGQIPRCCRRSTGAAPAPGATMRAWPTEVPMPSLPHSCMSGALARRTALLACLALPLAAVADDPHLRCIHAQGDAYAKYELFSDRQASLSGKTATGENYHCHIDVQEVAV